MRTLHTTAKEWLAVIPENLTVLKRTTANIKDPRFRFFEKEVRFSGKLYNRHKSFGTMSHSLKNVMLGAF